MTAITIHRFITAVTSKSSQSRIVLATITLLYLVFTAQFTSQWFGLNQSFIEDGDTRFDILNSGSYWSIPFNNICSFLFSALADGLLVSLDCLGVGSFP